MKNNSFRKFYLLAILGVSIASFYPLYMGLCVLWDMIATGAVAKENYPKYIIPYTPICVAILISVLLLPILIRRAKRFALLGGSAAAIASFFALEFLLEKSVVVTSADQVLNLENWQMYMCYIPSTGYVTVYKTQTPVDILMGNYNPMFKLHFYVISLLLILSILNCLYGFAHLVGGKELKRKKPLILQSCATIGFLGLCILACFTAFWRDGNLQVSPLSAILMTLFFILFGVVGGIYVGSFLLGKKIWLSIGIPALVASLLVVLMYIGEMILLNGHFYLLGSGFLFNSLPGIVFSIADLLIILSSGGLTALALYLPIRMTKKGLATSI